MAVDMESKLPNVGTTIFSVMSRKAADHGAINLSQGFPDFAVPEALMNNLTEAMRAGHNQYAPMMGILALREAIAAKVGDLYARSVDPESEVTITSGATEALFNAIQAVVKPGDEVIVFDPAYDSYEPAITLAGGITRRIPLVEPDFHVDWDQVRAWFSQRTRLIIINTPHNPSGAVLTAADLDELANLIDGSNTLLLSDEVYEHIVFDGAEHSSVLRHDRLAERAFVVSSFGKTYHCTGWKLGYCIAPTALTTEFRKIHQYVTFASMTPAQHAFAQFMTDHPEHHQELPAFYQAKRDRFVKWLAQAGFTLTPARGTYFQVVDYSTLADEPDIDFISRIIEHAGVAAIPVSVFYGQRPEKQRLIRFCFAKDNDTLDRAGEQLCNLFA